MNKVGCSFWILYRIFSLEDKIYSTIPVSRSVTVVQAARKAFASVTMVRVLFARVMPV